MVYISVVESTSVQGSIDWRWINYILLWLGKKEKNKMATQIYGLRKGTYEIFWDGEKKSFFDVISVRQAPSGDWVLW